VAISAKSLLDLGSATLGESGARPMAPRIRAVWRGARVAGPAYCVQLGDADNLAIHVAAAEAPPGSVLVVAVPGPPELGYWGEVLTTQAVARGIAGLVIDGGVRDTVALEAHAFPVFSATVALPGAAKVRGGHVGRAVTVGDAPVEPGDWVVADEDGVAVIPGGDLDDVLAAGAARADKEKQMFIALRRGETTLELLSLDPSAVGR
jgi:4-hydroxy-4-methyl-2-oxoglutarate aldolase